MYIQIGNDRYSELKSLSFAPEVDLTLARLPVNAFTAVIVTSDRIPAESRVRLYDDMDQIWASGRVTRSERIDRRCLRIVAQSDLGMMDRWWVGAQMFTGERVYSFIYKLLNDTPVSGELCGVDIQIADQRLMEMRVTGFCPRQRARDRLHWLCLTVGALVNQCYTDTLQLISAPDAVSTMDDGTLIPLRDTYWKPEMTQLTPVHALSVTGYRSHGRTAPADEEAIMALDETGQAWYFVPETLTFLNEEAPSGAGREVDIDGVWLIHAADTFQTLSRLSAACFRSVEMKLSVINNRQYRPGQRVRVYLDEEHIYLGHITSCDFTFGQQARSEMVVSVIREYI